MRVGQARFLFGDQYRSRLGPRRDQGQPEEKTTDLHLVHWIFLLTNTDRLILPQARRSVTGSRGPVWR
jgi:hypothetical protein